MIKPNQKRIKNLFFSTLLILLFSGTGTNPAADLTDQEVLKILTREEPADRAIRKALGWLRKQQQPSGQFGGKKHATAMTSFGIMAFLSAGITVDHSEHGVYLLKAIRYVLEQQDANGYFGKKDGSKMYGHGVTTLMLAEAIGMVREDELEERIRKSLTRAVALTVNAAQIKKSKSHQGGWRYNPTSANSDLSLSGWQLLSLHAAQQVGITVPEKVIRNAVAYTKRNSAPDGKVGYQSATNSPVLRGLGLLCLSIGGIRSTSFLLKDLSKMINPFS